MIAISEVDMRLSHWISLFFVALSAFGVAWVYTATRIDGGLLPIQRAAVENAVRSKMIDPGSAQFEQMEAFAVLEGLSYVVCGNVNGKNRIGGYAGRRAFAANLHQFRGSPVVEDVAIAGNEAEDLKIKNSCAQAKQAVQAAIRRDQPR